MKLYKDLGDIASKLFSDDFTTDKKLKLSSKTSDGATYTLSTTSTAKSDSLIGEFVTKLKRNNTTLTGKLLTSTPFTAEAKYDRIDMQGRRTAITLIGNENKAIMKSELTTSSVGVTVDVDVLKKEVMPSISIAIAPSRYSGYAVVGAKGSYSVTDGTLTKGKTCLSYFDGVQSELSVEVEGKADFVNTSYSHLVRPGFSVAGQMKYDVKEKKAKSSMVAALKLDPVSTIKGKIETDGLAALAYIQKVRPHTTLVLSSTFDVLKFDTAKVGASLTLE